MIRAVRPDEVDAFFDLTLLVDLHMPADQLPALKDTIAAALTDIRPPFSHGLNHFLFATLDDQPVGAVHVGPARWMLDRSIPARIRRTLVEKVSSIDTIAVHSDHRCQGIATAILARVENDFAAAGYRALALRHEHRMRHFFTAHGFTSLPRLAVDLGPAGLFTEYDREWKYAVKPLDPAITFTTHRGLHVLSGLLN
ncbi:GNAT family N-acetyltransferase [Streptomyces zhihengii]|uniref:GNAT family N-acetyltransferase n=1 Tax=Streptomyces zhihengii TaxID=1818004 RepID=UPI003632D484